MEGAAEIEGALEGIVTAEGSVLDIVSAQRTICTGDHLQLGTLIGSVIRCPAQHLELVPGKGG